VNQMKEMQTKKESHGQRVSANTQLFKIANILLTSELRGYGM
jgi:hypothetical protein